MSADPMKQHAKRKECSTVLWMTLQRWKPGQWDLHHALIAPGKFLSSEQCFSQTDTSVGHCQITKRDKHFRDTDKFISQVIGSPNGPLKVVLDNSNTYFYSGKAPMEWTNVEKVNLFSLLSSTCWDRLLTETVKSFSPGLGTHTAHLSQTAVHSSKSSNML